MNRTIKFRGKCLDNSEWVHGDLEHNPGNKFTRIHAYNSEGNYEGYEDVVPDTVGQFTGLLDINGTEIYEGDILDTKTSNYCPNGYQFICKWIYSGFALIYQGMTYSEKRKNPWMNRYPLCKENVKDLCIIGNIHDNPELIKSDEPE